VVLTDYNSVFCVSFAGSMKHNAMQCSASEVTTIWRYTNVYIIIIIIIVVRCSAFMTHIVGACRSLHWNKKESEIEYELAEFLKHAPHRPGGAKFKVTA